MIILRGLTPTEDPAKIESLQQYNQDFRHDRKRVVKMIATMQSTRFLAKMISSYKEVDWVKELYEITDDIFREWYI